MEITVIDVNDNAPTIAPVGILEVDEGEYNMSNSKLMTTLSVTDRDLNSQLQFSITNNPGDSYSVNSEG